MAAPEWGAGPTNSPKIEIAILDRADHTASLKVLWGFDANGENPTALDYIDAAKCNGRWQGINIVASRPDGRLHRPNWDQPLDRWPRCLGRVSRIKGTGAWHYRDMNSTPQRSDL